MGYLFFLLSVDNLLIFLCALAVALAAITWKYYICYIVVQVIFLVLFYFFLRETRNLTTEEAAVVYDSAHVRDAALEAEKKLRAALDNDAMEDDKMSTKSVSREEHVVNKA